MISIISKILGRDIKAALTRILAVAIVILLVILGFIIAQDKAANRKAAAIRSVVIDAKVGEHLVKAGFQAVDGQSLENTAPYDLEDPYHEGFVTVRMAHGRKGVVNIELEAGVWKVGCKTDGQFQPLSEQAPEIPPKEAVLAFMATPGCTPKAS